MEFFRAGEALLRSSQPILPFLAPSAYRSRLPCSAPNHRLLRSQPIRSLTTSQICHQQESAAKAPEEQNRPSSKAPSSPYASNITPEFGQLLDSVLSSDKNRPAAPTNQSPRSRYPSSPSSGASRREATPPGQRGSGAISELLDMFAKSSTNQTNRRTGGAIDIGAMLDPNRNVARPSAPPPSIVPPPAPMKLNSSVGRTIQVDTLRGMDVARAFRALDIQCARNKVRRDSMMQRFHERPGLKRKRLKRERWRKRFKENFVATVNMVQRMKAQGW